MLPLTIHFEHTAVLTSPNNQPAFGHFKKVATDPDGFNVFAIRKSAAALGKRFGVC